MADAIHGGSLELDATKQDLVAALVQKELKFMAKLLPSVTDVSSFAVKGAQSISFPKLGSFTVTNRAAGAQGDATVIASTADQLLLDKNAYIAYIVDPSEEIESVLNWELELARRAASAHARYVDEQIISELETAGKVFDSATVGDITRDIVLEMRKELKKRNGDEGAFMLTISPDQEESMLKINEFTRHDYYGSNGNIPSGQIGTVYGVPVMVHNGLADDQYFMYDKSALAVGFQLRPNMSEQGANEYGSRARRVAIDQKFGVKGMQINQEGVGASESALIVKDAN